MKSCILIFRVNSSELFSRIIKKIEMGIWDVLKKKLAMETEEHHEALEDGGPKSVYEIAAFDLDGASITDKMKYLMENRSQGEQIQFADKLLREGPYEMAVKMYQALIQKYPEERDRYENGIGSAQLKLGQFEKAIDYYLMARDHGMHPEISDKHIWDACQKHFQSTSDSLLLERYVLYCPEGKYRYKAAELLKGHGVQIEEPEIIAPVEVAPPVLAAEPIVEIAEKSEEILSEIDINEPDMAKERKAQAAENQLPLFGADPDPEPAPQPEQIVIPEHTMTPVAVQIPEEILEQNDTHHEEVPEPEGDASSIELEISEQEISGPSPMLVALDQHLDQYFDNEDVVVWSDKRTDDLRIDVYHIKPNADRDFHLLITSGMSATPMNVPEGAEEFKYAELMAILPESWDMTPQGLKNPANYWPVLWLKNLARIPKQYDSWLCYGHSIPNGDPSRPIANTNFEGIVIMDSATLPDDFQEVKVGNESLYLYSVVPVYAEEMAFKIEHGIDELREVFSQKGISDWIRPGRKLGV